MDTIRNTDVALPSGSEVESASFHVVKPMPAENIPVERSGLRGRLDDLKSRGVETIHSLQDKSHQLKSRGVEKMHSLQRQVSDRSMHMQSSLREGMNGQVMKMNTSMRTSPMKWVGVAAGAGFALGLAGRIAQWRHKRHSRMPDLVIIDAC